MICYRFWECVPGQCGWWQCVCFSNMASGQFVKLYTGETRMDMELWNTGAVSVQSGVLFLNGSSINGEDGNSIVRMP